MPGHEGTHEQRQVERAQERRRGDGLDFDYHEAAPSGAVPAVGGRARLGRLLAAQQTQLLLRWQSTCGNCVVAREIATPATAEGRAEARAATPSAPWAALPETDFREIRGAIRRGEREGALERLARALMSTILGRVTIDLTENLGTVGGTVVGRAPGIDGMAIPYVLSRQECTSVSESDHWQLHTADEIRFQIQVHPRVFSGPADEQVSKLHSTLMHEARHVEQQVADGIDQRTTFAPRAGTAGQREFLGVEGSPAQSRRLEALDEIDAAAAEIENAERTGLDRSLNLRHPVNYLWRSYREYVASAGDATVNAGVARRVQANVVRGRRMFVRFLESPAGRSLLAQTRSPESTRRVLLAGCPEGYDPRLIARHLGASGEAATAE